MQNFIDVSNHQSGIKLAAVPTDAVIVKATEGKGWRDGSMPGFVEQVRAIDKPLGFYPYVSQGNTPQQEADNLLSYTEKYRRDNDLIALDWEPIGNNPSPGNVEWAVRWLDYVSGRIPNPLWTYMNLSTANAHDWRPLTSRWPHLWLAHYPGNNRANGYNPAGSRGNLRPENEWQLAAWQFTDGGQLPGFSGKLDLNELYIPWWNQAGIPVSNPVQTPASEPGWLEGIKYKIPWPLPNIREADPYIELVNSHGDKLRDSRGRPRKGCICMQVVLVLVEREMIRQGLIKYEVDVFQAGYNAGGVAASAGTHDWGGVLDVAQGITRAQRGIWAMFGAMCAPRTREWGWNTGDHGHLVIHGCVHRHPSAYRQIINMMNGYNGLVSNRLVNWVKPDHTWQQVVARVISSEAPKAPATAKEFEEVPKIIETPTYTIEHGGVTWQASKDHPLIGSDVIGPLQYNCDAWFEGPPEAIIETRFAVLNRKTGEWTFRSPAEPHASNKGYAVIINQHTGGEAEVSVYFDVKSSRPGPITITQRASCLKV